MTPEAFRSCLAALDWTQRGLAARLSVPHNTVHRWAAGQAQMPAAVAVWLETLAEMHRRHPLPEGWPDRGGE